MEEKNKIMFPEFYEDFVLDGMNRFMEAVGESEDIGREVYEEFRIYLTEQLQSICIRMLIVEMHICKSIGNLGGNSPKEEYRYFCEEILSEKAVITGILERYPVLSECIEERIVYMVSYYCEIIKNFRADLEQINRTFCKECPASGIRHLESKYSDLHNHGRHVLKIELDNGISVLYKPRSMRNDKEFRKLLQWIGRGTGLQQLEYPSISYEDHSWCSIVEYKPCQNEDEIKRYYKRLGDQLFLAYSLGTNDLHYENVIASGEYPVLIDLETLVKVPSIKKRESAEDEIYLQLAQSVIYTGILPLYSWNGEGEGVDCSGISGGEEGVYPFKIPVVISPGTSDMRIAYEYPKIKKRQNRVTMEGRQISPVAFKKELMEGFSAAYQYVLNHKETFEKLVRELGNTRSRLLVADTQRYSMILASSYHPSLLQKAADREEFLGAMWKGRGEDKRKIVENEIQSLSKGDIPYYEYRLNDKRLYSGQGEVIDEIFDETPIELLMKKIHSLSEKDMEIQKRYMQVAMELTPENRKEYENKVYFSGQAVGEVGVTEYIKGQVEHLIERLIKEAVWNEDRTQVNWCQTKLSSEKNMRWRIGPMDMYLYSGLSGMLLVFHELKRIDTRAIVKEIYETLERMVFGYTDRGIENIHNLQSKLTGIYEGEASIIYAYLCLYEKEKEVKYLYYAIRHGRILEQLIEQDKRYDLLSGNAGAAQAFIQLYEVTQEAHYLEIAERAIELLEKNCEEQERGVGWKIAEDIPPMSGMAHGNAGVLIPVVELWVKTGKDKYRTMAEKIWEYEDSLYSLEINNWLDLRVDGIEKDPNGAVAWCHGAGGILISRVHCYKLVEDPEWKERMIRDITRAYGKLSGYWKRDSWSLCHGICGNLWMLEEMKKRLTNHYEKDERIISGDMRLLPQEMLNPGLMAGYGGMIHYFLKKRGKMWKK